MTMTWKTYRMCSHHRVNGCDRLASHDTAAKLAVVRLLVTLNATSRIQSGEFLIKEVP